MKAARRATVDGTITSSGFGDGHRFAIGDWPVAPIAPLCDVMWATPEDERILLVGSEAGAEFITSIYEFDEVRVGPLYVRSHNRRTVVSGHGLELDVVGGRSRRIPVPRSLSVTSRVEAPIARALMGVEVHGSTPTGAREWYQAHRWRWIVSGGATLDGFDLGSPVPLARPMAVGFSEPPRRPSIVSLRVTIEWAHSAD